MSLENWTKILQTKHLQKIQIAKAILLEHNIESVIINKTDSMYQHLIPGEAELYVHNHQAIEAKFILSKSKL